MISLIFFSTHCHILHHILHGAGLIMALGYLLSFTKRATFFEASYLFRLCPVLPRVVFLLTFEVQVRTNIL